MKMATITMKHQKNVNPAILSAPNVLEPQIQNVMNVKLVKHSSSQHIASIVVIRVL